MTSVPPPLVPPGSSAASEMVSRRPTGRELARRFPCPACHVLLTVAHPATYNGQPAPCPNCAVIVIPPRAARIAPAPNAINLHPLPGFTASAETPVKTPRALPRRHPSAFPAPASSPAAPPRSAAPAWRHPRLACPELVTTS